MKKLLLFLMLGMAVFNLKAQTLEELKAKKAKLEASQAAEQAKADAFNAEIADLAGQIEKLSGWQTGVSGLVGFNLGGSNNWQSNANKNSSFSNLNIGINAFANIIKEKSFWRNTIAANMSWQSLDTNTDDNIDGTGFDRNADALIGSSLYGFRLNQDIAVSMLGDLNTSVGNILKPGSLDFGAGVTWTPQKITNLAVVIHPLTYHIAFSGLSGVDSQSALGAKIKATYSHTFPKGVVWSSNLGAFFPYSSEKYPIQYNDFINGSEVTIDDEAGLFEYTWINTINIADVWKGIGVGFTLGLRGAKFEFPDTQTFHAIGLTYGF